MTTSSDTRTVFAAQVKAWALEEGFTACAIAQAGPVDAERRLSAWISAGYHADMDWLPRTQALREDPRQVLPGAQSVVMVAAAHPSGTCAPPSGHARVARYAWSRDYHRALRKPLLRIAAQLDSLVPDSQSRVFVDSGPVLERGWGALSGLGWIGKNSLLLHTEWGSWFLLGTLLTTVSLAPDTPLPDRCGSCRACIEACPTGAILKGRQVDARKCIAYHTIENRGEIPDEIAGAMGDWIFGCDICQEVCPWNRKANALPHPALIPRPDLASLDPALIAVLDDTRFLERFAGTSLMRAKAAGMRRNAMIAARNLLSQRTEPSVDRSTE